MSNFEKKLLIHRTKYNRPRLRIIAGHLAPFELWKRKPRQGTKETEYSKITANQKLARQTWRIAGQYPSLFSHAPAGCGGAGQM